jgi:hypothetical protein
MLGKQAPEFQFPKGLDPLCLQKLLWLLVAQHQQAGLLCCLQSRVPVPDAAAMTPGSPSPNTSRPQGASTALWALEDSSLGALL